MFTFRTIDRSNTILWRKLDSFQNEYASFLTRMIADLKSFLKMEQAPAALAVAFALGTLLSFIPVPILDTLFVGAILNRYKQLNRAALLCARFIWNDLVVVPLYVPGFRLGMALLKPIVDTDQAFAVSAAAFALGIAVLAVAATLAGTLLIVSLYLMVRWRRFWGCGLRP